MRQVLRGILLLAALALMVACTVQSPTPTPAPHIATLESKAPINAATPLASSNLCAPATPPAFLKSLTLAEDVSGEALVPVNATDVFSPNQNHFHAIIALESAPAGTQLKAVWYLLEAKGFVPNTVIETTVRNVSGSGNFDFTLAPSSGAWPIGAYCVEIYADEELAVSRRFSVQGAETNAGATIVQVTFAEDIDPNTFAPVNPTRTFAATAPKIHCIVQVQDAATDTHFVARWLLPTGVIKDWEEITEGSRRLDFELTPNGATFPVGNYHVELYVNGKLDRRESFGVH